MASSFVRFEEYGFWSSDGFLQIWLYFLVQEINHRPDTPGWLKEAAEDWALQAQGLFSGSIYVGLDEYITVPTRKELLIDLSNEAIKTLQGYGKFFLSKEMLNRPELGTELGIVWTADIPVKNVVKLGEQFIKLLKSDLKSTVSSQDSLPSVWQIDS